MPLADTRSDDELSDSSSDEPDRAFSCVTPCQRFENGNIVPNELYANE